MFFANNNNSKGEKMIKRNSFVYVLMIILAISITASAVDRGYLTLSLDNSFVKLVGDDKDHSTVRSLRMVRFGWNIIPELNANFYAGSGAVNIRMSSKKGISGIFSVNPALLTLHIFTHSGLN